MTTKDSTNKTRTSLCREWERNRRNKFNDAIAKLGEVVKAVKKTNESSKETDLGKDNDNAKSPKIEIVQNAILCLTNYAQEKTQLKAEILALQVKLEASIDHKTNKKDASTQVYIELNKKNKSKFKDGKYVKVVMMQKSKRKACKEGPDTLKESKGNNTSIPKLPNILPRCNIFDKKAPENTIVVLPAAPYIFPQRPLLFPTVPPAIVVVDPNLQPLNKSVPIISRNSGDITKTTMVNILPISAYSRPLSASKNKKSNVKMKSDIAKKPTKKNKTVQKTSKEDAKDNDTVKTATSENHISKEDTNSVTTTRPNISSPNTEKVSTVSNIVKTSVAKVVSPREINQDNKLAKIYTSELLLTSVPKSDDKVTKIIEKPQCLQSDTTQQNTTTITTTSKTTNEIIKTKSITTSSVEKAKTILEVKPNKTEVNKIVPPEDRNKENKLPNILETSLCDNVVDGGNARLELAEEFLAASPTAAFLMSFPLVSGNRADSPAEEPQSAPHTQSKDNIQKRNDLILQHVHTTTANYLEKNNTNAKPKPIMSKPVPPSSENKPNHTEKQNTNVPISKTAEIKASVAVTMPQVTNENPFLNLPMPSLISTNCTMPDTFGLDFDCNINKTISSQPTSYGSNNNLFYKNDPFSTVKSTIYSTSSISSNHEFNGFGLYPCAMEKYTSSKSKTDFGNIDDSSPMKIGSSRLTYDIDLGWSHKGFDFVNCTTSAATLTKDNILTTVPSAPLCTSYNPFNPEFHVPLVSSSSKKEGVPNKVSSSFADTITNFYSQPSNLWSEEPFYTNSNVSKALSTRPQNYLSLENTQTNSNIKQNNGKYYEVKDTSGTAVNHGIKSTNHSIGHQLNEKYTKKSPSKMHINWMTSEIRPMQNNCNPTHAEIKEPQKLSYNHLDSASKRHDNSESNNYFPLSMHNFSAQTVQDDFHVWPSTRPLGTTEISIDPPPINLPTLVGDLALGPHDKKKNLDSANRSMPQQDIQNCTNFFSVTQLMNRSNDNLHSRYQPPQIETSKSFATKQNIPHYSNDSSRKVMSSRVDSHIPQPYVFNEPKHSHSYDNMSQFSQMKTKSNSKADKNTKTQKNNYSAEALLRGGNFTQKIPDNSNKFLSTSQKYGDFNTPQDTSVAQVSHFPSIIDYSENSYAGQQFSGTSLYNTTTNTISNSFYSNFMPASSNLMSSNYASGPFPTEFIDYNQSSECSYSNHKYEELKMRNNLSTFPNDKVPYKSSRRESATKHKLECSKKEGKKYQSKRSKLNADVEEWNDPTHNLWQNKTASRKGPNLMSEDLPFPNYVSNQMPSQYQPDFFNSHLMPSNMQPVGHNVDRSLTSFPITSRANFNLSTIFPEITMKVQ